LARAAWLLGLVLTLTALVLGPPVRPAAAEPMSMPAHVASLSICPITPDWFHASLVAATQLSGDLPPSWADSPYLAKIVCWQGTNFEVKFADVGDSSHRFHGLFAMAIQEVQTIAGPWMSRDRYAMMPAEVQEHPHRASEHRRVAMDLAELWKSQGCLGSHRQERSLQLVSAGGNR
jgi:hypothetical protein